MRKLSFQVVIFIFPWKYHSLSYHVDTDTPWFMGAPLTHRHSRLNDTCDSMTPWPNDTMTPLAQWRSWLNDIPDNDALYSMQPLTQWHANSSTLLTQWHLCHNDTSDQWHPDLTTHLSLTDTRVQNKKSELTDIPGSQSHIATSLYCSLVCSINNKISWHLTIQ
jgi:hypothetical protein